MGQNKNKGSKSFNNYHTLSGSHLTMFKENVNLIYWYMNEKNLDIDYSYDILAECLADSIVRYDSSRGSLSNYFYNNAYYAMTRLYRKKVREIPNDYTSVSFKLEVNSNIQNDEAYQRLYTDILECLDERDKKLFLMLNDGYKKVEIAKHFGVSRVTLASWIAKLREKVRELMV